MTPLELEAHRFTFKAVRETCPQVDAQFDPLIAEIDEKVPDKALTSGFRRAVIFAKTKNEELRELSMALAKQLLEAGIQPKYPSA